MKRLLLLCAVLLMSCEMPDFGQRVVSQDMSEPAVVEDVIFSPAQHGSTSGLGLSTSGNLVITSSDVHIEAKYAVVFRCAHGKFIIQGTSQKYKDLWNKMVKGKDAVVTFREVYRVYKDGRKELVKYDFVDAEIHTGLEEGK